MEKKELVPEQAKPYVDALREIIAPGLSAAPLEATQLVDLPVVRTRAGSGATPAVRAQTFVEILDDVVREKLKGKDIQAGQRLFALGEWAGVPSRDRYEAVAKLYGRNSWDYYRKEPLTRYLYAVYLALFREGERLQHHLPAMADGVGMQAGGTMNNSATQGLPGSGPGYLLELYDITYNLPTRPGEPRERLEVRRIRALRDGVTTWRAPSRYWGKNPDESPTVTLFGSGTLRQLYDGPIVAGPHAGRAYMLEVDLPEVLGAGDTFQFTILRRQNVAFEDMIKKEWEDTRDRHEVVPTVPIETARIQVRFPREYRPARAWHFEELPDWLTPGVATDTSLLTIDASGSASFSWTGLWTGYAYGIAWEW
jgi:hypothetical protein